ncbi:MAG: hypothetical protein ACPGVU_17905 [Limisphaerales bacterium]
MAATAGALGLEIEHVATAKRAGCKAFQSNGTVHEKVFQRWWKRHGKEAMASIQDKSELERRRLRLICERIDFRNAVERGEYIRMDDVARRVREIASGQYRIMRMRLENELPYRIVGLEKPEIRELCRNVVDQICRDMQELAKELDERNCELVEKQAIAPGQSGRS